LTETFWNGSYIVKYCKWRGPAIVLRYKIYFFLGELW